MAKPASSAQGQQTQKSTRNIARTTTSEVFYVKEMPANEGPDLSAPELGGRKFFLKQLEESKRQPANKTKTKK